MIDTDAMETVGNQVQCRVRPVTIQYMYDSGTRHGNNPVPVTGLAPTKHTVQYTARCTEKSIATPTVTP